MTLRELPAVDRLRADPRLVGFPPQVALQASRLALAEARQALKSGATMENEDLLGAAVGHARRLAAPGYPIVINATGIVLHTNLGRATLAPEAALAARNAGEHHCLLEFDVETGGRGSRQTTVADLLRTLTGAEDALVVNNNAGATMLAVAALAGGREVVLSRGEMIEIGGHFRLPEVIEAAGARLVEVGTTNRTRISDYSRAVGEHTALLLKCHTSNFKIVGFTEETSIADLATLGSERGVWVGDDLGSGALVDLSRIGLTDPPTVASRIDAGADLIWFSGDKLLGGPQCGIVVGKSECVQKLARHPLMRGLRPDKMTLAALEATLRLYRDTDPWTTIPVLRRLATPISELDRRAKALVRKLVRAGIVHVSPTPLESEVGGGTAPGTSVPSFGIRIALPNPVALARALRSSEPAVVARIVRDTVVLDLRTVDPSEDDALGTALAHVLAARPLESRF